MEWLYANPEQGDSEALATWTSVRISFTAPFLLFAYMICFNFVTACWLYCFNVDVFVFFFIFGEKVSRAYVFVYSTCRIEIKFYLLTYICFVTWCRHFEELPLWRGHPLTFKILTGKLKTIFYVLTVKFPWANNDHIKHTREYQSS